jgi:hypothetical protein
VDENSGSYNKLIFMRMIFCRENINFYCKPYLVLIITVSMLSCAIRPKTSIRMPSFSERCSQPGVVKCFGFDDEVSTDPFIYPPWSTTEKIGLVDTNIKASGDGSLRFEIPSNSGSDSSGSFWQNFSDDLTVQFGEGQEFFVQWRQRFSPEFLKTYYERGGGWKQAIIGEGDRLGSVVYSCTQLELVVQNTYQKGYPQMYHSCGGKDGRSEEINKAFPVEYKANQWMTFQVHVKVGTWYKNDRNYHYDSKIELWVAEEGKSSTLVISRDEYDIANNNKEAKYGKVWLLPYHTHKDPSQRHPVGYTRYDDLIISTERIPDP